MLRFQVILFLLSFWQLAKSDEYHTLSKSSPESCFPINVPKNQNVTLDIFVIQYESIAFAHEKPHHTSVSVFVYRKKEVDEEKIFLGDYNIHVICDDNSIGKGYCDERHKGKILFEYIDDEISQGNAYNEIITEYGMSHSNFTFKESGYYCAKSVDLKAKEYKLSLILRDGHKYEESEREKLQIQLVKVLLNCLILGGLTFKWSKTAIKKIPYLVKVLLYGILLEITRDLLGTILVSLGSDSEGTWLHYNLKLSKNSISEAVSVAYYFISSNIVITSHTTKLNLSM